MNLVERLNSRAWEHRQHRALREEAARRIADLEAALRPFADYADHVPNDGDVTVVKRTYDDGTFGALFGCEFHEAAAVLRQKS